MARLGDQAAHRDDEPPVVATLEQLLNLRRLYTKAGEAEPLWTPLPHQEPPSDIQDGWLLLGGRGSGKTDAARNYMDLHAHGPACFQGKVPHRMAIIAPTLGDARTACIEGDSGLRRQNPTIRWNINTGEATWRNGSVAKVFGAHSPEDVERLRAGGNRCLVWAEELAAWRHLQDAWDQMEFGLRSGPHPHWIASTTPKPRPLIVALNEDPRVTVTEATTRDNPHLDESRKARIIARYAGTRLGEQEIEGRILADLEAALWNRANIEQYRQGVRSEDLHRIVVGVDPQGRHKPGSETGIVAAGIDQRTGHVFVLEDASLSGKPEEWAGMVIQVYRRWEADLVVAEVNYGGDMVRSTLEVADRSVPIRVVTASRGKKVRAEPVSLLYEQGRVHHASLFSGLEDQMCNTEPADWERESPDRVDALVWAVTDLIGGERRVDLSGWVDDEDLVRR
jgi:phage terminase large subunit-like protein